MTLWPGYRLGRYRVEREIAAGGQATVYAAIDEETGEALALKVLGADLSGDPTVRGRLRREAEAVRALDHPAIVPLRDTGEADGHLYLCMALIEGPSLQQEIQEGGGVEPARLVPIVERVASALDHAHARGMVHRDVKPANVLLDRAGSAYLADFGLAKVAQAARLTRTGMWVGTLEYIAPEQLMGQGVGPPADVYALSALAYEALAGRPPFVRRNPADLIQAHLQEAPRPPSARRPSLAFVDGVLARGLAKRPEERFPTAGALVRALAESLGA